MDRVRGFSGRELFPVTRDGRTLAGSIEELAAFTAPIVPIAQTVQAQVEEAKGYSQDSAESAEAARVSLFDFIGRWYGSLDADPTTNPLGEPVKEGDAYGNRLTHQVRIYLGGFWKTGFDPNDASAVSFLPEGTDAIPTTMQEKARERVSTFDYMTAAQRMDVYLGVGSIDVTDPVLRAVAKANSMSRQGLVPTITHPGCLLDTIRGRYNMATLPGPIRLLCNLANQGAEFVVPPDYAKEVFRIGKDKAMENLATADIHLPNVTKPVSNSLPIAGSVGVRIANLNASRVKFERTNYFEVGVWFGGIGEGTVYNDFFLGQHSYCKVLISWAPGAGGWCNANRYFGGNLLQSSGYAGGVRVPGWKHLLIDGRYPATAVVGNNFFGTAFEGNAAEYVVDAYNAYGNNGFGCYFESGAPFNNVAVAGDTITQAAHGYSVGDMLSFNANNTPGGMYLGQGYYVVEIPSADTYKVSKNKGKDPAIFSSTGAGVTSRLQPRLRFNQSGGELCFNNRLINTLMPPSNLLDVIQLGQAYNNGLQSATVDIKSVFEQSDTPIIRVCNRSFGTANLLGFYDYDIDPFAQPDYFSMSLGAKGVQFRENGKNKGRLFNTGGTMKYQRPEDPTPVDIPTAVRAPNLLNVEGLVCAANGATKKTFVLPGIATFDHLIFTAVDGLPNGLGIDWARVSAADTIEVCLYNKTAAAISLTAHFQACIVRRYY